MTEDYDSITQDDLYDDAVAQAKEFLLAFLAAKYPTLDISVGSALRDLLVTPGANIIAYAQVNMDRTRRSTSLTELTDDPTLADDDGVDRIISNWRVTRKTGTEASGTIVLILSSSSTFSIPSGEEFVIDELTFATTGPKVISSGTPAADIGVQLQERADGTYAASIPVTCTTVGTSGNVAANTVVTWEGAVSSFTSAYVPEDFSGGTDPQSNTELSEDLTNGLTSDCLGSRPQIEATLRRQFPAISAVSVIGASDVEMGRNGQNIFGIKSGNACDIYVRTANQLSTKQITKTAAHTGSGVMLVSLTRDESSACYEVSSVSSEDESSSYTIATTAYGTDVSDLSYTAPELIDSLAARFTKFQTVNVSFYDPAMLGQAIGATGEYIVTVSYMPLISDIQDFVSARENRFIMGDILVRAAIPVLLTVELSIRQHPKNPEPSLSAIRLRMTEEAGQWSFDRSLYAAANLIDCVYAELSSRDYVEMPARIKARIISPTGEDTVQTSSNQLKLPSASSSGVSPRTCAAFLVDQNIDLTVQQADYYA